MHPEDGTVTVRRLAAIIVAMTLATSAVAQDESASQLGRAGWAAINAGRIEEAAANFDEALKKKPTDPMLLLGAGRGRAPARAY